MDFISPAAGGRNSDQSGYRGQMGGADFRGLCRVIPSGHRGLAGPAGAAPGAVVVGGGTCSERKVVEIKMGLKHFTSPRQAEHECLVYFLRR